MVSVPHVDELFPTAVAFTSTGGAKWKTAIVEFGGGGEQRIQQWGDSKADFDIAYGTLPLELIQDVMAFHEARRGMAQSFNFKWHEDFQAFNMPLRVIQYETELATYQLVKEYFDGPQIWQPNNSYKTIDFTFDPPVPAQRVIPTVYAGKVFVATNTGTSGNGEPTWDPLVGNVTVDNTIRWSAMVGPEVYIKTIEKPAVGTVAIRVDDVPLTEGVDYIVNYSSGIVTFIPSPTGTPRADFEFYLKVRFGDDAMQIEQPLRYGGSIRSIPLIELRPEGV